MPTRKELIEMQADLDRKHKIRERQVHVPIRIQVDPEVKMRRKLDRIGDDWRSEERADVILKNFRRKNGKT